MPNAITCKIRGVVYPSMSEAARVLGLSHGAIWHALECGNSEMVGLGRSAGKWKPCRINGVKYPSQVDAANALGVTRQAIYLALKNSRTTVKAKTKAAP